ncbi:ABC transporter permease subunit [Pseudohongiella acticola]|mgnify:CR=1 FL=1|jgi:ABC-type transport system involved in multi-copper enzyme maturation permease subunit|uniref:ABC transporter permease subunit n=1 Tax=Pseudohongiella acticola TaxID=1524254 RepID=UPI0030EE0993
MDGFVTALKAELYVALRSNSTRLVVLLPAIISSLQLLLVSFRNAGEQARDAVSNQGFSQDLMEGADAWGALVDAMSTGLTLIGLILVAYAAWSFAGDKDSGALRHLLIRRVSRRALVAAKLVNAHIVGILSVMLMLGVAALIASVLWDFGPVVEDGYELIGTQEIHNEIRLGLILALIPLPAAIALGTLISVSTQNATQAITAALGLTLALDIFKGLMGNFSAYLYVNYQASLLNESYLNDVSRLVRGFSDVLIDPSALQLNQWAPWPQMLALIIASLIIVQYRKL